MKKMKTPIILLLCAVIAVSVCLTGCGNQKEKNFPAALSDTTRSALELNTAAYKDSDLETIYQFMKDGATVKQLNDSYEIECLRMDGDSYSVIYWGNHRVLVLHFDADGSWIPADKLHSIRRMVDTRGKFDKLKVGDSVKKVQTADPYCYFPFLIDPESTDLQTDHYSEDGYHTRITYDKDFNIASVDWELM